MTQALLLSTLLVIAAPPIPGKAKFTAAQSQFNRGAFDRSLELSEQAREEASDPKLLSQIHLLRGQTYGAMRDLVSAEAALAQALEQDPEATLDPNRVDPAVVSLLNGLRQRLRGTLVVTADKPNVKVTYDGRPVAARAQVPIGRHKVEVKTADGRFAGSREVVVRVGKVEQVSLTLEEVPQGAWAGGEDIGGPVLFGFGKPLADLRLQFDPLQWAEGAGIEVGGGLQAQYLRASVHFRVFPQFGLTLRGALTVPVMERLRAYVELELPIIFYAPSVAIGLGGAGGVDYSINKWLGLFGQVGARHFFLTPFDDNRLTLQGGARLRLP